MISFVTNASRSDAVRIRQVVPHWLSTFGDRIDELIVVYDDVPASGRIAALHGPSPDPAVIRAALRDVSVLDRRIRVVELPPPGRAKEVPGRWFSRGRPVRCQAGTPIFAFVYAIDQGRSDVVLRADCDMFFHEAGWLTEAARLIRSGAVDLIEPPRLDGEPGPVSSRVLILSPRSLRTRGRLPLRAHQLDVLRRWHRRLVGRPPWLAFEQMLQREVDEGRMTHRVLKGGGFSLHVASRVDMDLAAAAGVAARVQGDDLPARQRGDWNFRADAWLR